LNFISLSNEKGGENLTKLMWVKKKEKNGTSLVRELQITGSFKLLTGEKEGGRLFLHIKKKKRKRSREDRRRIDGDILPRSTIFIWGGRKGKGPPTAKGGFLVGKRNRRGSRETFSDNRRRRLQKKKNLSSIPEAHLANYHAEVEGAGRNKDSCLSFSL